MRVVDLGDSVAGRFAARLLLLDGADVVRPLSGARPTPGTDDDRFLAGYLDDGVTIVEQATRATIDGLIESADVVLTSYDAGASHGGYDDAAVRRVNPTVVHATTSSYGTTGPYARWRGGPLADWAAGGYLYLTGEPDRSPLIGPLHLCAYVAGYTASIAIEAALIRGRRSGTGTHIDVSTMESMLSVHQSTFERLAAGIHRRRTGRYTEVYPLTVRPCRDGHVALGVVTDAEFDRFLIALGCTELLADERFSDAPARMAHRDELDRRIDPILRSHPAGELVELLQSHHVASAEVASEAEVLANPQLSDRGFWRPVVCGDGIGVAPGDPVRLGGTSRTAGIGPIPAPVRHQEGSPADGGLPLAGTVVLDFTAFWAGPSATRMLADLGATVITVERPGGRLDIDVTDEDLHPEQVVAGYYHHSMGRGKQSLVLDLRRPEGQRAARDLIRRADVVVENFRPGVMARFGLGPAEACAADPALVYVSLSGFGSRGPWAAWGSYGPMIEAASSIEHRTGYEDGEPLRLGHTLPDGVGGLCGALAVLRGLRKRDETGRGAWYDISQLEAYVALSGEDLLEASVRERDRERCGNRGPALLQGVFRSAGPDSWIAVRLVDEAQLRVLGIDDPADGEAALAELALNRRNDVLARELQAHDIEAFPVLTPDELRNDAHLTARGFFQEVPFPGRSVLLAGTPLRADPPIAAPGDRAPRVGEHSLGPDLGS